MSFCPKKGAMKNEYHSCRRGVCSSVTFITFRGEITGGTIGTNDSENQAIEWKSFEEAQGLMPYLGNIRELLQCKASYGIEES
jgi:hypothetical protein